MAKNTFEYVCERIRETDNAVMVRDYQSHDDVWFPLSQVESMHFDRNGDGKIVVTAWIARQKGLL